MNLSQSNLQLLLSLVSLAVAVFYYFVWPKPRPVQDGAVPILRSPLQHIILRWFHSLTWVLLAIACWVWYTGSGLGNVIALLALGTYLVFIVTFLGERRLRKR